MPEELLPYYADELNQVRQLAAEFAKKHPKIAARLRISADTIEDPHVERLIEAFAYLNARIRHKLDDDFPELSDTMLDVLYPHYLAPIPSMAIVQTVAQADLTGVYELPAGVEIETEPVDGEPCRFHTAYPLSLWPIQVSAANMSPNALGAPPVPEMAQVGAVLSLSCLSASANFDDLHPEGLRFFLRGQGQITYPLYEALLNDSVRVVLSDPDSDAAPRLLPPGTIRPCGFDAAEGLLPYPPQSFVGYRLLTEFFAFPEKFLFVEFGGLDAHLEEVGQHLDIYVYFSSSPAEIAQAVSRGNFALGCTPVVNLYRKRAEPIQLDHTVYEYRVVPDARRPRAAEVYAVERVAISDAEGSEDCPPLFGLSHGAANWERGRYWKATRRPASSDNPGTEVYLSFVDRDLDPAVATRQVAHVDIRCLNRDLPARLPFGGGEPKMRLTEGGGGVDKVVCLSAPTATLRPPLRHGAVWRLISHLNLNHLSITDAEQGADALREILRLYDFRDSAQTREMIDGIAGVWSRPITARMPGSRVGAMARGTEITVEFDPRRFAGSGIYLFASVVERFLALYCGINSFTCLRVTLRGREGELCRWPPRAGEQQML
jgi:type VI secretion system protein ImpG